MKHRLLLPALLVVSMNAFAQTRIDVTMTVDSVARRFIIVRPSGPAPSAGYPVVAVFHGTGGDGERFYASSGWKEKGEAETFVTVYPSSLSYCFHGNGGDAQATKWNDGEAQQVKCAGQVLKDDVHFVRMMIDTLATLVPIDRRRIYASGFSNGGGFTSKLAVEMSDVFAAVAAAAGPLNRLDSALPLANIPIAYSRGDEDNTFIGRTGLAVIPFNDSCLIYFADIIQRYLGAFNLTDAHTRDSAERILTYRYTTRAASGRASSEFELIYFKGMPHEFPNGTNYPIAAADLLWPFFDRYRLLAAPTEPASPAGRPALYPNPAIDHVTLGGTGPVTLTLRTLLGEHVATIAGECGARIELPALPGGAYLAEISNGRSRWGEVVVVR